MTHSFGRKWLAASRWMILGLTLALTTMAQAAAGTDGAGRDDRGPDDDVMPGVVMVQFEAGVAMPDGAGKTGLVVFDRVAAQQEVYAIEKAFPMLEQMAAKQALSEHATALRRVYVVRFNGPRRPQRVAAALAADPHVVVAEPHYIQRITWDAEPLAAHAAAMPATPDDTLFGSMTHLTRLRLPEAWDVVKGEDGDVVIAIIDGGTDWRHTDLEANVWTNPGETPGNNQDDDGNGYIDDIHGWNFATSSETSDGTPDPTGLPATPTNALHGTAVAGAAAAVTNNEQGVAGTSWNARFMPINASCTTQDNAICFGYRGILYAAMNGADIINASWGGPRTSEIERQVIEAAWELGALVVSSAGNESVNFDREAFYPAAYGRVLSVGGTQKNSDANLWNYGRSVNVFAPGSQINSTYPLNAYGATGGTSFSSPLVAGIAALVKTANPGFTPDEVREQVRMTADNIDAANPTLSGLLGRGRVNAERAVTDTGNPAVRLTAWSYTDANGDFDIRSGETVDVTATFTNYLAGASGLTVELGSDDPFISFPSGSVAVGTLARGASATVTFTFELAANTPNNRTLIFYTRARAGDYSDTPDVFRLPANETAVARHTAGPQGLQVSITNEGNIGYLNFQGDSPGVGFVTRDNQGTERDLLFEGGLLVASGPNAVSDCVRGTDPNVDQHADFVLKDGTILEIISPAEFTTQQGKVELVDTAAPNPLDISVVQDSYVDVNPGHQNFILLRYTITNVGREQLANVHAGLFFDWDLNQVDALGDYGRFDEVRQMGYVQDDATAPTVLVGTKMLSRGVGLSYHAVDNPTEIYQGSGGGFTEAEKWQFLSGGLQSKTREKTDVSQLTGAGPFTIDPGASVEVAFAVVAGPTRAALLQNADNAQTLWDDLLSMPTATEDPVAPAPTVFAFKPVYPHPATPPTTFAFEVAAPSEVSLTIYDMLGRKVRTLAAGRKNTGAHTVVWDGADQGGHRVANGLYVARLIARGSASTFTQSRRVVVVR